MRFFCAGWPGTFWICRTNIEAGLVGSSPATYLKRFFWPVPSASQLAQPAGALVAPKYCISQASGSPSPSASCPGGKVTCVASNRTLLTGAGSAAEAEVVNQLLSTPAVFGTTTNVTVALVLLVRIPIE